MTAPALVAGSANLPLAERIAAELRAAPVARRIERFPDGELHVELLESVRGRDVYVVQPTPAPPEANFMEALQLVDAARRDGAARVTSVFPYLAYARQDRRAKGRECVAAKLGADLVQASGANRALVLDPHSQALEGFFQIPYDSITAAPLLADAVKALVPRDAVVVAPDLGAVRLAARMAALLRLPAAHVHKTREGPQSVSVQQIAGDVKGRTPILVDDMISTGSTLAAAARALAEAGAAPGAIALATHGIFADPAESNLRAAAFRHVFVTDSIPPVPTGLPVRIAGAAKLLAEAILRLHEERPLGDMALHT